MTDQPMDNLARELRESEQLEKGLTRFFAALQPPHGAAQRLLAKLGQASFHESQLTLDDAGPYSFEQAVAQAEAAASDLLAAGLHEQEIEDEALDTDLDPD